MKVVQEERDAVPPHFAALLVKVEMEIFNLGIVQDVDLLGEC